MATSASLHNHIDSEDRRELAVSLANKAENSVLFMQLAGLGVLDYSSPYISFLSFWVCFTGPLVFSTSASFTARPALAARCQYFTRFPRVIIVVAIAEFDEKTRESCRRSVTTSRR
jgi:hypothetical protein